MGENENAWDGEIDPHALLDTKSPVERDFTRTPDIRKDENFNNAYREVPLVMTTSINLRSGTSTETSRLFSQYSGPTLDQNTELVDIGQQVLEEELNRPFAPGPSYTPISASTLINYQTRMQKVAQGEGTVTVGSKLVAHLPRLQQGGETHISLLPCAENDKWVRMVWNKDAQDMYSIHDRQSPHVPSIIYRRQGTIEERKDDGPIAKRQRLK